MRHSLTIFVWLSFIVASFAQIDWSFSQITPDEGLSAGTVNCVFKDSKGFIWIGTADGLNRYDGYELTIFKNNKDDSTSVSGNIITALAEDPEGNIWVGTRNSGISIFDWQTGSFNTFRNSNATNEGQIRSIHATSNNQMLIGIDGAGILLYDIEKKESKQFLNNPRDTKSLSNDNVLFITPASKTAFWISSLSTRIDKFDIEKETFSNVSYDENMRLSESTRKVIFQDKDGLLWIGLDGKGLIRLNPRTKEQKLYNTDNSGLKSNIITALFQHQNGDIFIGTDGQGINVLNPKDDLFTYIQSSLLDPSSLSSDAIYQIYEDNSGVVWVSTFRGGVNRYSPFRTKFRHYKQIPYENNSLSFASVIDVYETPDGLVWIGTDGGGLDQLNPATGQFSHFKHDPNDATSISTNVAIAMEEDSRGDLWIGTYAGGVNRLNRQTGKFKRYLPDPSDPSSINSKNVWHILRDSRGTMWFGLLNGGLDKYDPVTDSFQHFVPDEGADNSIGSNLIYVLFEDSEKNFWIGTDDAGLDLFDRDQNRFTHFQNDPSNPSTIANNNVRTLFEHKKQLWIGTADGISIMDIRTKQISQAPVNELLPSRVINGIEKDQEGMLWISTNRGLSKCDPKSNTIQNFGKSDGLQGNEFNYTSSTTAQDGTMYFGGVNGLNAFHPSDVKMSTYAPKVVITDIRLFDQSINGVDSRVDQFKNKSIQSINELELTHEQNVLEVSFAALDYTSPLANQYRYQLEGFDQEWVYTNANKRSASYTNLDAGTYTFTVEGTNSDGVWSSASKQLTITILPPWWQTWWFRTLVVGVVLVTAYLIFKWRAALNESQKEHLRIQIEQATQKSSEQNIALQHEQEKLESAIKETNEVVNEAVQSGNFSARINLEGKSGSWLDLGESINTLFDSIVIPFQNINEIVGAMASSNLTIRYTDESKGDILKMTSSLNYALDNLSTLISTVRDNINDIGSASEEMRLSSQEMNNGTAEIAAASSEVSSGAQEQVTQIDSASNELEQIKELSSSVGEQANAINTAAKNGVNISAEGLSEMHKMEDSMSKMKLASQDTGSSIDELITKSAEISGILNSIKEISVETNMLALNAAIEAAKAGDAGRGFAVVAEQIRRLAENSSSFTNEIEFIVEEVQKSVELVNRRIAEMGVDIQESATVSQKVAKSFSEISSSYENTFELSKGIVSSTDQQFNKVKEVVHLMETLVVIAEESAAGTEQIASSSTQLSAGMTDYQAKTQRVSEIIEILNEKMSEFKLG